jgi:ribosomal protein S12 methylthiotransferase accessory factor
VLPDREVGVEGPTALVRELAGLCDGQHTRDEVLEAVGADRRQGAERLLDELLDAGAIGERTRAYRVFHERTTARAAHFDAPDLERLAGADRSPVPPAVPLGAAVRLAPDDSDSLGALLDRRRSTTADDDAQAPGFGDLSALLRAAYVRREAGHRPVASGGGWYPLLVHALIRRPVGPLGPGVWWLDPEAGELRAVTLKAPDVLTLFARLEPVWTVLGRQWPVCFVSADLDRAAQKSANRSYRNTLMEAGAAMQNVYLAAAERGIGVRAVAGWDDHAVAATLGLGEASWPLLALVLGGG